ncbi:hypothetical protein NJ76_16420 [Rhodococcus sp. IITR03]|nr:hypothetical protein NJ76_16420 [Rhodococcus sp. IITR03]
MPADGQGVEERTEHHIDVECPTEGGPLMVDAVVGHPDALFGPGEGHVPLTRSEGGAHRQSAGDTVLVRHQVVRRAEGRMVGALRTHDATGRLDTAAGELYSYRLHPRHIGRTPRE